MNERELIILKLIAQTEDLHEKYFILVNMFNTLDRFNNTQRGQFLFHEGHQQLVTVANK